MGFTGIYPGNPMQPIASKNVIVTGAAAGLGRAIAIAFAKAGAHVGLIARSQEGLSGAQSELAANGALRTAIAVADVAEPSQLADAAQRLESELGPPDIWVNNAMETIFSKFDDITPEEFRRVTEVDYLGFVYGTQEALKRMLPRGQGHIIQIGSALAYRSIPLQSAYCGAKAAIRGFTDSLRCELIHNKHPIHLTIVHMPALNTPQFSWARTHLPHQPKPVGDIFQPEVGADAVLHAARYPRREYWVCGSTVAAIIGNKFFPGWMDRKMAQMSYEQQWVKGESATPRAGNLFTPADARLHKTHGRFDAQATTRSPTWSIVKALSRWL
jgi:NAD(P)-dependent dehydrogenase (short-subunit alcohol dehydrogenase family)